MQRAWRFCRWLVKGWHISYTAIGFCIVLLERSDGNSELLIVYAELNADYFWMGLCLELIMRRRLLHSARSIIPKQPEP